MMDDHTPPEHFAAAGRRVIEDLAQQIINSGVDPEEIGRIHKLGGYQSIAKIRQPDGTDELVVSQLHKWEISPKFADGPDWPVIDRGPAIKLPKLAAPKKPSTDWMPSFIWPDTQIGYFRDGEGNLIPTHDEASIDVALQLLKAVNPEIMVRVGDDLDLPEMGKYRLSPAFSGTTQAAIDRNTVLGAQQRQAMGSDVPIYYIAGNHEERFSNYIMDNSKAAFGIRKGRFLHEAPSQWPVLSVPELCRLDEFGITYLPGYPAGDVIIAPGFRATHGHYVTGKGQTAQKYLDGERESVVYGHIHRREYLARTFPMGGESQEIFAASPGCLARIDGAVPSTKGGTDLDGRPITKAGNENWQQGVGVAYSKDGMTVYENVPIMSDGPMRIAFWRGKEFVSGG